MKLYSVYISAIVLLSSSTLTAQHKITGTVSNNKDKPIAGAQIFLDSINSNVKTNKNGEYQVLTMGDLKALHVYTPKYGLLSHD